MAIYLPMLLLYTIFAIESRLYIYLRYEKDVKPISGLTRHINTCKIPIFLICCQLLNSNLILNYNITNLPNLPLNNNKEDITIETSNNNEKKIKLIDINNNKKDIRLANINKQRLAIPNKMP